MNPLILGQPDPPGRHGIISQLVESSALRLERQVVRKETLSSRLRHGEKNLRGGLGDDVAREIVQAFVTTDFSHQRLLVSNWSTHFPVVANAALKSALRDFSQGGWLTHNLLIVLDRLDEVENRKDQDNGKEPLNWSLVSQILQLPHDQPGPHVLVGCANLSNLAWMAGSRFLDILVEHANPIIVRPEVGDPTGHLERLIGEPVRSLLKKHPGGFCFMRPPRNDFFLREPYLIPRNPRLGEPGGPIFSSLWGNTNA